MATQTVTSVTFMTTMSTKQIKPLLNAFILRYEAFCIESNFPHYKTFSMLGESDNNTETYDIIYDNTYRFIQDYISTHLYTREKQNEVITEYGIKKLIDLKCELDGDEICDELLEFDNHIEDWLHTMLMNVIDLV